jgi:hypothetical protein
MTDAKQGDNDQRKIRSSSLRTQRPPVHLLILVLVGLVVLGMLVPLLQAGLVALNCQPHRHLCVAWLQPLPRQFQG